MTKPSRTLEEANRERRERARRRKAMRPPADIAAYGMASTFGMLVFGIWYGLSPSLFASLSFSLSLVVFAAWVAFEWRWKELNGE